MITKHPADVSRFAGGALGRRTSRLASLECLRIVGAFGIVVFHQQAPGAAVGYAALPLFILMAVWFTLNGQSGAGAGTGPLLRTRRFLLPWLFWSAVYGVLKLGDAALSGAPLATEFRPWMLATGAALHLWFLPFIAVVTLVLSWPVCRRLTTVPAWAVQTVGAIVLVGLFRAGEAEWRIPVAQWVFAAPSVIAAVMLTRVPFPDRRAGLLAILLAIAGAWIFGISTANNQLFLAVVVFCAARAIPLSSRVALDAVSGLSLGVYLLHPAVAAVLIRLPIDLPDNSIGFALMVFCGSLAIAAVFRMTPVLKRVV